jgi:hypothetical protein
MANPTQNIPYISGLDSTKSRALRRITPPVSIVRKQLPDRLIKRTMRQIKNRLVSYSPLATSRDPYQNTSEITKNDIACENEYSKLEKTAVRLDCRSGSMRLSEYKLQQSSSRVRDATVRMAAAASQASWAEASCATLFVWSLSTTTRCAGKTNVSSEWRNHPHGKRTRRI